MDTKPVADLTEDEINDEIRRMWADSNGGELPYYGFGNGGPASEKSKNYVRVLLRKNQGVRDAEIIRRMLNGLRESGEGIGRLDILPAIKVLKAL